jgi:hypothetical protein
MKIKSVSHLLLTALFLFVASSSPAQTKERPVDNTTSGTFKKIEEGDYTHIWIKSARGTDEHFICGKGCEPFIKNPTEYKIKG